MLCAPIVAGELKATAAGAASTSPPPAVQALPVLYSFHVACSSSQSSRALRARVHAKEPAPTMPLM